MQEYTLKFNEQQMQVLNMALGEIPFKLAAPLVREINEQIESQRRAENESLDAQKE